MAGSTVRIARLFGVLGHGAIAALFALAAVYCFRDGQTKLGAGLALFVVLTVMGRVWPLLPLRRRGRTTRPTERAD